MPRACQVIGSVAAVSSPRHDVVGALLVRAGRVLLCHRSPDREWYPDVWDIPGGHVETGEAPAAALARELAEELGVDAEVPDAPIATAVDGDLRLRVWRIDAWRGRPANRSPDEHDAFGWFTADEACALALAHPSYLGLVSDALARPT
jgi:8-oxo-dGTP pyrophosphatase MutT (NUDIX family)